MTLKLAQLVGLAVIAGVVLGGLNAVLVLLVS